MTITSERLRSIEFAHRFLCDIVAGHYKRVPMEVKSMALKILRHYPSPIEFDIYYKEKQ